MKGCDWCNKPIRPWQRRFGGRLFLEHATCHRARVRAHSAAWMLMSQGMRDEERKTRWYPDLVADGMIPDTAADRDAD